MEPRLQSDPLRELAALRAENAELRARLAGTEEVLAAIRSGSVDAVVVGEEQQAQVYTLRGADHPYRVFVETMQEGSITLAEDQTILYANQSLAQMVRTPLEKVIGTPFDRFVAPGDRSRFAAFLAHPDDAKCELRLQGADAAQVPVFLSRATAELDGMPATCLVVTDLTQQKRHEAIVASERLARSVLEQAAEPIVVCDERGCITHANVQAEHLCDASPLWCLFDDAFPLELVGEAPCGTSLTDRVTRPADAVVGIEAILERPGRAACFLLLSSAPLRDDEGRHLGAVVVLTNITERKAAERERERLLAELARERAQLQELTETLEERVRKRTAQVQALSRSLTLAEQRERRRLSQVLHDDLQQILFGAELRLGLLHRALGAERPEASPVLLAQCRQIRTVVQEAVETSRTLSVELNPPILDGEGLGAALDWLGAHMANHYGLDVHVEVMDEHVLERDEQQLVVQLIRELLFNVVKHAGVPTCRVTAREEDGGLTIAVEDDGAGFDVEREREKRGSNRSLGLFSVEERLRLLGGVVDIESQPQRGTRIVLRLPPAGPPETSDPTAHDQPARTDE